MPRLANDMTVAAARTAQLAHAVLDDTLTQIDLVVEQKCYYSGKHMRHDVNIQALANSAGPLVWTSPALLGAVHDLTAARTKS
jgi:hypothetical protein